MKIADPSAGGTGTGKSSRCADLAIRRPTEVDDITGSVARPGREHGAPTPWIDTLVRIVKRLESHCLVAKEG